MPKKNFIRQENILAEAERYAFAVIVTKDCEVVGRNAEAKRIRSLSRACPMARLTRRERKKSGNLEEGALCHVAFSKGSKQRSALVLRLNNYLVFVYLPMLDNIAQPPCEISEYGNALLEMSRCGLSDAVARLSSLIYMKPEIRISSFIRVCSMAATYTFSEDMVCGRYDVDGYLNAKAAFSAFGRAVLLIEPESATELSEPCIEIELKNGSFSLGLYGAELYTSDALLLTAVSSYSYTAEERSLAFALAVALSIVRGRKNAD